MRTVRAFLVSTLVIATRPDYAAVGAVKQIHPNAAHQNIGLWL